MPITERVTADLPVTIKTQNYSLLPDDFGREVQFENTIALSANLLPVAIAGNGYNTIIRNVGPGTLTIQPSISENIDGAASAVVAVGAWQWIRSDGTEWKTISSSASGAGSVTEINTAGGLTGGPITGSGTISIAADGVSLDKMAPGVDGNLISYDANGDPAAVATGSSGEVLTSNGAGAAPTFQPVSASGGLQSMQVFTAGGTWTKPAGITKIKVTVVGGGGGSGGCLGGGGFQSSSPGGGAGGAAIKLIDVSAISSETVTIGAAGTAGATGNNPGGNGGTTSFGAHCSSTGGAGGLGLGAGPNGIPGGVAGVGSGGTLNLHGGNGGANMVSTVNVYSSNSGRGGASYFGDGGADITSAASAGPGVAGVNYGSGAGGAAAFTNGTQPGGVGAAGTVIIEEYS